VNRKILGIVLIVLAVALAAGSMWFFGFRREDAKTVSPVVEKYTQLNIELKEGKLTSEASTYLVQPGIGLEFHISSNKFGKVSVPTEPPQTITFTESPLIFKFNASRNPGSYALVYQAEGGNEAIQIGTIVVKGK